MNRWTKQVFFINVAKMRCNCSRNDGYTRPKRANMIKTWCKRGQEGVNSVKTRLKLFKFYLNEANVCSKRKSVICRAVVQMMTFTEYEWQAANAKPRP